jgi:hypothetical protein
MKDVLLIGPGSSIHGSSGGYGGYKLSFDLMLETHKKYLKENNINIKFLNNNSYYKKLEWKK